MIYYENLHRKFTTNLVFFQSVVTRRERVAGEMLENLCDEAPDESALDTKSMKGY